MVGDFTVEVTDATMISGTPGVGSTVEIKGTQDADDVVHAGTIKVEDADEDVEDAE